MKNNLTIENAWVCSVINTEIIPFFGDLLISNGIITKIRPKNFASFQKNPTKVGKDSYNAYGRVVTIPHVNFHDHIYSRLAKGLPLKGKFDSFQNVLKNLWWKIDRALDLDIIKASAQYAAIDSIQNGVTYIFDHHSSQTEIRGSLHIIKNVLNEFGLRGVLCFESTDRNGSSNAIDGINENVEFLNEVDDNFKAMLGLHASFTLSDELLFEARKLMKNNWGIHIHVAEDESDNKLSLEYAGAPPVNRLKKYKLMNDKSILVHGVHLQQKDYLKIIEPESALALCLDSNMNNAVGLPQFSKIPNPIPLLIGTDGMHSNISHAYKQLYLVLRDQGFTTEAAAGMIKKVYIDQINFVRKYFEDFPILQEKERADFVVWDYIPPTSINKENFWGHFIYGILESRILSVVQNGRFLMKDFQLGINAEKVRNEIFLLGERLYGKLK
jgi:cytosine/adenosine deaminase-related metal-dependent hydrolase